MNYLTTTNISVIELLAIWLVDFTIITNLYVSNHRLAIV